MKSVKYTCSHNVMILTSKTLVQMINDYSNNKVKSDDVDVDEGRLFVFFYKPNSFFNKVLSEVSIPKEHTDTLRINNINRIYIGLRTPNEREVVMVFLNEAFKNCKTGVGILASTEYI